LGKIKRFRPVKDSDYPITMAEDCGRSIRPQIKRNGATFGNKTNRCGAAGRYYHQRSRRRGGLHL
jgi:hypothetical protein